MATNLLFVSAAFPPKSDPECLQTAKYFKYLKEVKAFNIEVVTSKAPTLFMPVDESLRSFDSGYKNKVELPVYETKVTNFLLRKVLREGIDWPDSKLTFHWQSKRVIKQLRLKPDVIYSRSYPLSSTVLAYKLQKFYQVPWVLHLSDPWSISPIHNYSKKQQEYHKKMEQACFLSADKICLTSEKLIEKYKNLYPSFHEKFEYFPNVYDKEEVFDNDFVWGEKLKIVYTGGLAGLRSPDTFFEALLLLEDEVKNLEEKLEVVFAGPIDRKNSEIVSKFQAHARYFKHIGSLPYAQALALQKKAHILLIIDNPIKDPEDAVFFPSKILDYLLAKRRILALTTIGGTTDIVLNSLHGDTYSFKDPGGIADGIFTALKSFEQKKIQYFKMEKIPQVYEASYNVQHLQNIIKCLSSGR